MNNKIISINRSVNAKKKVLILEDNEDLLECYKYNLEEAGALAYMATSVEGAIKLLDWTIFDYAIVDYDLGAGLPGSHFVEEVKRRGLNVIMLANSASEDTNTKLINSGCDGSIEKDTTKFFKFLDGLRKNE